MLGVGLRGSGLTVTGLLRRERTSLLLGDRVFALVLLELVLLLLLLLGHVSMLSTLAVAARPWDNKSGSRA